MDHSPQLEGSDTAPTEPSSYGGLPYYIGPRKVTLKKRKNIRLQKEAYSKQNQIFSITICTKDRKPLFEKIEWAIKVIDNPVRKNLVKKWADYPFSWHR